MTRHSAKDDTIPVTRDTVREMADRVAEALRTHLPHDEHRHRVLNDFSLLRYWAEDAIKLRKEKEHAN